MNPVQSLDAKASISGTIIMKINALEIVKLH